MKNIPKALFVFISILACTIIYIYMYDKATWGTDDANIYMVYMKNLANGHGFVYNVGGERVEGFTSLLWCIIGAAFYMVSKTHYHLLLIALNIVTLSYSLYRLLVVANKKASNQKAISLIDIFVLATLFVLPGFIMWNTFGLLETGFWTSLITLALVNILESAEEGSLFLTAELSAVLALMVFTRPESYVWGLVFLTLRFICVLFYNRKQLVAQLLMPAAAFTLSMAALFTWRISYFGYAFPNTYYAKVSANKIDNIKLGLSYLRDFLFDTNPFALIILILLLAYLYSLIIKKIKQGKLPVTHELQFLLLSAVIGISILLPIGTGGDPFLLNRFYQPIVPALLVAFVWLIIDHNLQYYIRPKWVILVVFTVSLLPKADLWHTFHLSRFSLYPKLLPMPVMTEFDISRDGRIWGDKLNKFFKDNHSYPSQGIITAGGQAYNYHGKSIDLLGLNNVEMAHADKAKSSLGFKSHASFNKAVFYKQQPDLMCYSKGFITDTVNFSDKFHGLSEFWPKSFMRVTLKSIVFDDEFKQQYKPVIISKRGEKEFLYIYASNAFIEKLDSVNYSIKEL